MQKLDMQTSETHVGVVANILNFIQQVHAFMEDKLENYLNCNAIYFVNIIAIFL